MLLVSLEAGIWALVRNWAIEQNNVSLDIHALASHSISKANR